MSTAKSLGFSPERLARIDRFLQAKYIDAGRLAGVQFLLARGGEVAHQSVLGMADAERRAPLAEDTVFRIYSMTKPVTGVAMMMLFEEGKWRLNDPVSRYIPEFARMQVYTGENPDGSMKTEDARRSMTMRELMTHTAGLGYTLSEEHAVDPRLGRHEERRHRTLLLEDEGTGQPCLVTLCGAHHNVAQVAREPLERVVHGPLRRDRARSARQ